MKKKIVWNKVTWYSKLLAAIFFIFVVPLITFKIGTEYAYTRAQLKSYTVVPNEKGTKSKGQTTIRQDANTESGIFAQVTTAISCAQKSACEEKPYTGQIIIKRVNGEIATMTEVRKDGSFFALLTPGSYTIIPVSDVPMPSIDPVSILIEQGRIAKKTIRFEINPQS